MAVQGYPTTPGQQVYDVVIIGGAIMGAATAWFLTNDPDFDGSVLVVERDPSYQTSSTAHTNSCMRQQFSTELNVRISQFAADYVKNLRGYLGGDPRIPDLSIQNFGYMYLADTQEFADTLRADHKVQRAAGAGTRLLSRDQIAAVFPFYNLDDIILGSHNTRDEGYWDGGAVFDWWRRLSRAQGAEYVANEVTAITRDVSGGRVASVTLKSGEVVACGQVVNASGPRAARTAAMAGLALPVEPRKRYTWVVTARDPLDRELPLTIDPSGVHVRQDGPSTYMVGAKGDPDPAVAHDDFAMDHGLWENHVWPILANRIPQFESLRIVTEWAGHYAYNTIDQNAVTGAHPELTNFFFLNGFSGHGLQQSPAMGRGTAEMLVHGAYRTLDLSPFHFERLANGAARIERAVI